MHQSQLEFFENLITSFTFQTAGQERELQQTTTRYSIHQVAQEKVKFLKFITNLKFQIVDEQEIKWVVNAYHEKIVQLLKDADQLNSTPHNEHLNEIFRYVYHSLTDFLAVIESTFSKYLDLSAVIPVHYESTLRRKISEQLAQFRLMFKDIDPQDPLVDFVASAFEDFLRYTQPGKTTYQHIHYLAKLIHSLCNRGDNEGIEEVLFYLNFNSPHFVAFYTQRLLENVQALPQGERLEKYSMTLKEIRQKQQKPGLVYKPLYPPLKDQLEAWIMEEINFIRGVAHASVSPAAGELAKWNGFKIETAFSVPQFAYIIKLFADAGIFTNHNKTEMIEFFSTFFTTAKTQSISAGSLRKNYYNEDASVSDAVCNVLFSMINRSKGRC